MRGRGCKRQSKTRPKRTTAPSSDPSSMLPDSQLNPQDFQLDPPDSRLNAPDSQLNPRPSSVATPSGVYARIVIQPAPNKYRFRYKKECLARSAGTLPGASSTRTIRRYPTIQIGDHEGAVVLVSCITKDKPYRAHPHELVGREFCDKGVCKMVIKPGEHIVSFNFGIQSAKICDVKEALELRESMNIDPFKQGFVHKEDISSIDLKVLRLCFQVYLKKGIKYVPLSSPLVSNEIFDNKAINEFRIHEISHCSGPVEGGTKLILTCDKVSREGLRVTFFTDKDGKEDWSSDAEIKCLHKQVAITLYSPPYRYLRHPDNVTVYVQLRNGEEYSNAIPFEYIMPSTGCYMDGKKRKKLGSGSSETGAENVDYFDESSLNSAILSRQNASATPSSSQDFLVMSQKSAFSDQTKLAQTNATTESFEILASEPNQAKEYQSYDLNQSPMWSSITQPTCLIQQPSQTQYSYVQDSPQSTTPYDQSQGVSSHPSTYQDRQVSSSPLTTFYEQSRPYLSQVIFPYHETRQESQNITTDVTSSYQQPQHSFQTSSHLEGQGISSIMLTPSHQPSQRVSSLLQSTFQQLQESTPSTPIYQQLQSASPSMTDLQQRQDSSQLTSSFQQIPASSQMTPSFQEIPASSQMTPNFLEIQERRYDNDSLTLHNILQSSDTFNQMPCNMADFDLDYTQSFLDELLELDSSDVGPHSTVHRDGDVDALTDQLEALHTSDLSEDNDESDDQHDPADGTSTN